MQTLFLIHFKNRCKIGLEEFFKRELLFKRTKYKKKIPKLKFLKKGTNLIKTRSQILNFSFPILYRSIRRSISSFIESFEKSMQLIVTIKEKK